MRSLLVFRKILLVLLFFSCIFFQYICSCPADAQVVKAQEHHSLSADSASLLDLCTDCGHTHSCCSSKRFEVLESSGIPISTADDLISILLTITSTGPPKRIHFPVEHRDQYVLCDKPKIYLMKMSFLI